MTPPTDPSYTAQALRTESPITPALQTRLKDNARLVHAVLGLQTEAGELADPVKKYIYYGRPLDPVNLREEIGDCLWYLAIACDALGTTLEAEQARNLAKLRARYPHVFTAEAAQVRDLDRERQVLEGAEVATLRQQLAAAQMAASDEFVERQMLTVEQQQDAAAWQQQLDSANAELSYLRARLDEERSVSAGLRQQLDAARAETVAMRAQRDEALNMAAEFSGTGPQFWKQINVVKYNAEQSVKERAAAHQMILMQRHWIERLQACLTTIKTHVNDMHDVEDLMLVLVQIREVLESLDESTAEPSTESNSSVTLTSLPAPVAEPATCPECERLQAFVGRVRELLATPLAQISYDDMSVVRAELAALDDEPTPVAEPEGGK